MTKLYQAKKRRTALEDTKIMLIRRIEQLEKSLSATDQVLAKCDFASEYAHAFREGVKAKVDEVIMAINVQEKRIDDVTFHIQALKRMFNEMVVRLAMKDKQIEELSRVREPEKRVAKQTKRLRRRRSKRS